MKKNLFLLAIICLFLTACDNHLQEPANYAGNAKRTETNCLESCDSCTTNDKLELSLDTEKTIKGITTGSCIAYGETCLFSDACSWSFDGTYVTDGPSANSTFSFTSCNGGKFRAEGYGSFRDGKSSGNVKCFTSDTNSMVLEWTDVPLATNK